jgi:hypothetical protein
MKQWANYPQVESSPPPLSGLSDSHMATTFLRLRADGVLAIPATRAGGWHIVRPLTLGLISLALAIVLWGVGYRLSLYGLSRSASARVGVAKLWVGPRQAACADSPTKGPAQPLPDSQLVGPKSYTSPCYPDAFFSPSAASASYVRFRSLVGTLRSPPAPPLWLIATSHAALPGLLQPSR